MSARTFVITTGTFTGVSNYQFLMGYFGTPNVVFGSKILAGSALDYNNHHETISAIYSSQLNKDFFSSIFLIFSSLTGTATWGTTIHATRIA